MATAAYLDWNATAKLRPEAQAAVARALDVTGNPSSVHSAGRAARRLIEDARDKVAALVGVTSRDVVFTSGGTEANMLALSPALGEVLLISAIEHPSVRSGGRFAAAEDIAVTPAGVVDLAALERQLAGRSRPLVSLMLANNETGVIQPVAEAAALVHAAGGLLHVDAVQGPGRITCDFKALGADLMTLSSHKIGGPQGVGALIRRDGLALDPQVKGGGQERGARAGTENVAGIAGFGAAAEATCRGWTQGRRSESDHFWRRGGPAAQYDAVFGARHEGRNRRDRLRSRRGCGVLRRGLFVRKGRSVPCSGRHGGGSGTRARRNPGKSRLCNHR
jgi:cysteine desulfurase